MLVLQERVLVLCSSCRNVRLGAGTGQKGLNATGIKKPPDSAGGFSGNLGFAQNDLPLSIRQRLEMPEKVKIKLGGHDGLGRLVKIGCLAL